MKFDERFNKWFEWLLQWEGTVFENDPDDPGGATKFGIDQRSHPNENIRNLTKERAKEIYWNEYWTKCKADKMPFPLGEVVANIAVNAGHGRASKWLQVILNVSVDGIIGNITLSKINKDNAEDLAVKMLDRTEQHYRSIAKGRLSKFLKGWLNRNNSLGKFIKA